MSDGMTAITITIGLFVAYPLASRGILEYCKPYRTEMIEIKRSLDADPMVRELDLLTIEKIYNRSADLSGILHLLALIVPLTFFVVHEVARGADPTSGRSIYRTEDIDRCGTLALATTLATGWVLAPAFLLLVLPAMFFDAVVSRTRKRRWSLRAGTADLISALQARGMAT
jgi:hypothetical protein